MRAFFVGAMVLALVGTASMQQSGLPQNGNLLGNLLGGLGLTGPQQPNGRQGGLLGGLLGGLSPTQGMGGMGGMGGMNGLNPQALSSLTQGLTDTLGQVLGQGSRQGPLGGMGQGFGQGMGMNQGQSGLGEMLSQIPRRTLELVHQIMDGVSRMLPGGENQMGRGQRMQGRPLDMLNQQSLQGLAPAQLQNIESMIRTLTQQLQQGRMPDVNQLTSDLSRTLGQGGQGGQQMQQQIQDQMRQMQMGPQLQQQGQLQPPRPLSPRPEPIVQN